MPFLDSVRDTIDLREQITKIEPQPVITRDNVTMEVDAVIYSVIVDPVRATYEVQNLRWGLEQLTLSALRNVIGQLDLDHTLSSRDTTNTQLRAALDSATQQWGVKVMRIELKNITPPEEIRLTMEKQMTAERTRRAVVTTAEGEKSSAILRAEGQKQSQIVNAEGAKQAAILAAEGQAEARLRVAQAEAQAIQMVARSDWRRRQSGAVPDRAALSRIARRNREQRQEAGVHALRSERRDGVAGRHQGTASAEVIRDLGRCGPCGKFRRLGEFPLADRRVTGVRTAPSHQIAPQFKRSNDRSRGTTLAPDEISYRRFTGRRSSCGARF